MEIHNEKHNQSLSIDQLIRVYKRGEDATHYAWSPRVTVAQAAMARVNLFLKLAANLKVQEPYPSQDNDILTASDRTYEQENGQPFWAFTAGDFIISRSDLLMFRIADSEAMNKFLPPQS